MSAMIAKSLVCVFLCTFLFAAPVSAQQSPTTPLTVRVTSAGKPLAQAEVRIGALKKTTSAAGEAVLDVPAGDGKLVVSHQGYVDKEVAVAVVAGRASVIVVELEALPTSAEEVFVTATRSEKRVQDDPLRVEVLGREEVEEKLLMTPGDIAMLLSETTGLRVQVTSPGLGAASLRIQGLRGRYTQLLADGLPLYGGQSGSIGLLQIPPMDLGQVEVIKGVASSLFGSSALGGVVNLVSRRPPAKSEHEVLINQTTQGATNFVGWLSGPIKPRWGYTLLADVDHQFRNDVDDDGWSDIAGFTRAAVRPRVFWDNGSGRNAMFSVGTMVEQRRGGTESGAVVPDGSVFPESLDTTRFDAGVTARLLFGTKIVGIRGSAMTQGHTHVFGDVTEEDRHATGFGEVSVTSTTGRNTWVVGGSVQSDAYRGKTVPEFDYTFWVPSIFAQDDFTPVKAVSISGSARVDHHSRYGTFVSPRVSALLRLGHGWTARGSAGLGYFAPTPLTEETEAVGLSRLVAFDVHEAERARSYSADVNKTFGTVEINLTAFGSKVSDTTALKPAPGIADADILSPLAGPTRTAGAEALAKIRHGAVTVVASYTFTHSTEPDRISGIREEVDLTPRHTAGLTAMWEHEGRARIGVEAYYTGEQHLSDNPYRTTSVAYPYFGALAERQFGRLRLFINAENLTDRRQTRYDSLLRPARNFDGRWTVDAWGPLEGRVVNGGIRVRF